MISGIFIIILNRVDLGLHRTDLSRLSRTPQRQANILQAAIDTRTPDARTHSRVSRVHCMCLTLALYNTVPKATDQPKRSPYISESTNKMQCHTTRLKGLRSDICETAACTTGKMVGKIVKLST